MDLFMGMNSGSSFDGIDVVLCETEIEADGFPKAPRFICGGSYPWPEDVKAIVNDAFVNKVDMVGLNRLNYICGAVFAQAAAKFMRENSINPLDVKVLGLDTQTIYQEQPNHTAIAAMSDEDKADWPNRWLSRAYPCGLQMGESSVIANLTNVDTVTHFRPADHTFGGSAAPIEPFLEYVLFRKNDYPSMTLNVGGIANIHVGCNDRKKMFGFDTGPGNVISNYMMKSLYDKEYDKDGAVAAKGKVDEELLAYFMSHPFFERPVPRSGWIADYNADYIKGVIRKFRHLSNEDLLATACAFTGAAVSRNMTDYIPTETLEKINTLYVNGGGFFNPIIMREIQNRIPQHIKVASSAEIGMPPEFKEAITFGLLAYANIHEIPVNIPAVGRASQYAICGKLAKAPRNIKGSVFQE